MAMNRIPIGPALGEVVRELREAQGRTLAGLARDAEVNDSYARGIEQGRFNPSLLILGRLAEALGTRMSELIIAAEERDDG